MSPSLIVGLEITVVLGGLLGFAGWELWQLRRDRQSKPDRGTTLPGDHEGRP